MTALRHATIASKLQDSAQMASEETCPDPATFKFQGYHSTLHGIYLTRQGLVSIQEKSPFLAYLAPQGS